MRALGIALQVLVALALLAGTLALFAGGASMDATARPDHPHCEHSP